MASSSPLVTSESVPEPAHAGRRGEHDLRAAHGTGELEPSASWNLGWLLALGVLSLAGWFAWPMIGPRLSSLGFGPASPVKPAGPRVTPVNVVRVEQKDVPLYLNGLGTVTALKTVTIRSRVEGELTKIAFQEGQFVEEGDLLAEVDPRPYQVQKDQAEGQMARDEASLRAAKQTQTRLRQLFEQKIATAQQIDDQLATVQQLEGVIKADQAQIAQADLQLTYCRILAPISGRIGLRLVDEGNMVRANEEQGIAVITQLRPIALVFTLPQDEISRVQKQFQAAGTLTVEAYDRELRQCLATGKLAAIDNQVDPMNGTVKLKAEFENETDILFPNQFVNVRLLVETQQQALVVPSSCVQRGPDGPFVFVVQAEETVEKRNVVISATEGGQTAVSSGLAADELVVTSGLDRLSPGAKVSTRTAETDGVRDAPRRRSPTSDKRGSAEMITP